MHDSFCVLEGEDTQDDDFGYKNEDEIDGDDNMDTGIDTIDVAAAVADATEVLQTRRERDSETSYVVHLKCL